MPTISAYDSNSISVLFSSLPGSTNKGTSLAALTMSLSDYNLIQSGSYGKLMSSYFAKTDAKEFSKNFANQNSFTNSVSEDSSSTLSSVKSSAEELQDSASKLLKVGTGSVFSTNRVKDESGDTVDQYDTDKIYSAVKDFISDYNSVLIAADKSKTSGIQSTTINMIKYTSNYESALKEIGITIDSATSRLSIDEEKFKSADMEKVKSLFNGSGSYAYNIKAKASMIQYKAQNESSKTGTYTNSAKYNSAFSSGSLWDSFF